MKGWRSGVALLIATSVATGSGASEIVEGALLPPVALDGDAGELYVQTGKVRYRAWSSRSLTGLVHTVYHLAARLGIDSVNKAFIDALEAAELPAGRHRLVTILNIDDVVFSAFSGHARKSFEDKRLEHPEPRFVLDDASRARNAWGLAPKGSAVIIIGSDGKVLRYMGGKLGAQQIADFIDAVKAAR